MHSLGAWQLQAAVAQVASGLTMALTPNLNPNPNPNQAAVAQVASGLTMGHYADERLPLPDALLQLREAMAAAPPPSPATPPPTTSSPAAPPDERTCIVCWDAPREVSFAP